MISLLLQVLRVKLYIRMSIVGLLETHSFGNPGAVHPEHGDLTQAMDKHEKAPKGFFLLTAGSTASVALYTSKQPSRLSN